MIKQKKIEYWKPLLQKRNYRISDLGRIKALNGTRWEFVNIVNDRVFVDNESYFVSDLIKTHFSFWSPQSIDSKHTEVLDGLNVLHFTHLVPIPTQMTDMESKGFRMWCVPDGFICVTPERSVKNGRCKFIFPYKVGGERAYICKFEDIKPLSYRQTRNSGTVHIAGNSKPVIMRNAVGIIYKEITKARKYYSRILPTTKILRNYASNSILNATGQLVPAYNYNGTVYVLYVDYASKRAEYKELIPWDHLVRILDFVKLHNKTMWDLAFGFSQNDFEELIKNSSNP